MVMPLHWIKTYSYLGVFSSLMLGMFGAPVPDETILTFTGFLIYRNFLQPAPAVLAAFLGSTCGISLNYLVGRTLGFRLLRKYGWHLRLTEEKIAAVRLWFEKYGKWSLLVGYFLPGVRHLTAFTAGASRLNFRVFASYAFSGGLLWVISFIVLGYFLGEEWRRITPEIQKYLWAAVGALIFLALLFYLIHRLRRPEAGNP